ncbi:hypothetical protein D3C74_30120 [compost metagenome]
MKQRMSRILGGVGLVVMCSLLAACGESSSPSQVEYDRLEQRIAELEQRLAERDQKIAELTEELKEHDSVSVAVKEAEAEDAEPGKNGPLDQGEGVRITFEQYQQVEIGMTYEEVAAIMGGNGNAISESSSMAVYSYFGTGGIGANAVFTFQNGKLLTKAQSGLDG